MPYLRIRLYLLAGVIAAAAGCEQADDIYKYDFDRDGVDDADDCEPEDGEIYPGAEDPYGDGVDQDCDGHDGVDKDNDGFPANVHWELSDLWDCNDYDPTVNPAAAEVCDETDHDCDGSHYGEDAIDCSDYYEDDDEDGYGLTESARCLCEADILNTVEEGGDCDDWNADIYPGATEYCDGIDSDCNGTLDDEDAADCVTYFLDVDGDGWGDQAEQRCLCGPEGDHTAILFGDCDDGDAGVNPDAEEECNEEDTDCNGIVDDNCEQCTAFVPGDHGTIQGGIDAAEPVLCVYAGTYYENLDFGGNDILVLGLDGAAATTIDGGGLGSVVTFDSGESVAAELNGFSITGGVAEHGGGIRITGAEPTLRNLIITGNESEWAGGGLYLEEGASPLVESVVFEFNHADSGGGGVGISDDPSGSPVFRDCDISGNNGDTYAGALWIYSDGGVVELDSVTMDNNTSYIGGAVYVTGNGMTLDWNDVSVAGNFAGNNTGGVLLAADLTCNFSDIVVSNNHALMGAGGLGISLATMAISGVSVVSNYSEGTGGGIKLYDSDVDLSNSMVFGNIADGSGGGIYVSVSTLRADHVLIAGNATSNNGGGLYAWGGMVTGEHLAIVGNTSQDSGGVLAYENSTIDLTSSVITGNQASYYGGGVGSFNSAVTLHQTLVTDNDAQYYGGFYLSSGTVDLSYCDVHGNLPDEFGNLDDPTGLDGNVSVDAELTDLTDPDPLNWDLHLQTTSPLIDAGDPAGSLDLDGSLPDMGIYGSAGGALWDLDGDTYPLWWQPGAYDFANYPAQGWDCDDLDPAVYPGGGC